MSPHIVFCSKELARLWNFEAHELRHQCRLLLMNERASVVKLRLANMESSTVHMGNALTSCLYLAFCALH
jgi:hypothetical protein